LFLTKWLFSVKWTAKRPNGLWLNGDSDELTLSQMAFGQTVFGQMVFRSNSFSVKNSRWKDFSVKWSRTCKFTRAQQAHQIYLSLKNTDLDGFHGSVPIWVLLFLGNFVIVTRNPEKLEKPGMAQNKCIILSKPSMFKLFFHFSNFRIIFFW
jgi:hypothetical protein